jgi:hypothetical protein
VELIRDAAGGRFDEIELGALLLEVAITDRVADAQADFLRRFSAESAAFTTPRDEDILASPVVAIGTLKQVCEKLWETRAEFGFSYFWAPPGAPADLLAPVIECLAGT